MWYVEKLYSIDIENNTLVQSEPCIYCDPNLRRKRNIHVVLRNSDDHDIERLHGQTGDWLKMEKKLRQLNPYGFVSNSVGVYMLTQIDPLALKFLEYVDSVDIDRMHQDSKILWKVIGFYQQVWFWDELNSLVGFGNRYKDTKYAFTLFDVMVYMKRGWIEDKFYMLCPDTGICSVSFTDVGKARSMISKAAMNGYNPIEKYKKWHVGVMIQQQ